jgi:[ribosomal protein S18]-alanine N-acetyltransferase
MASSIQIQLATAGDARWIAELSRDEIETGLGWRWQQPSIVNQLRDADTNVIVARVADRRAGFAIMNYIGFEAHLILFAVAPVHRRRGVGAALIRWLIATAEVAGAQMIYVELRKSNRSAHAFYQSLDFKVMEPLPDYYNGHEAAVRMVLDLRRGKMDEQQTKP